ncbi:peptide deformylase [Chishuiella changwenlii]|jgi:peptide deformylase|uniref:Peptide deformylase n=2 Tax=Chishuiella changwenlii TaxID=1434701 RepID=A0A1M6XHQ2_9FLAO|nr:peptide deformylase [Chishuiella changwenlii]SHL05335.1 peptide deformylase [Chishuiella changwenlii]
MIKKLLYGILFSTSTLIAQNQLMNNTDYKALSKTEINLIQNKKSYEPFRVLLTTSEKDTKILRKKSIDIDPKDPLIKLLADRMYATVQDEASKGVGIAAPQIGINRNAVWVQRFDKEGEPFEFIINPKITWYSDIVRYGREGCLSIPDEMGQVYRSLILRLQYYDLDGNFHDENVEGFTAVIFQHEYDHLIGTLFTDRIKEQETINYIKAEVMNEVYYIKKASVDND